MSAETFRFRLGTAVVVCGHLPGTARGQALELKTAGDSAADDVIRLISTQLAATPQAVEWKLVGPAPLIDSIKKHWERKSLTLKVSVARNQVGLEILFDPASGRLRVEIPTAAAPAPSVSASPTLVQTAQPAAPAPLRQANRKTRVLIVDDSETIRTLLRRILSMAPDIDVVGATGKPTEVKELIQRLSPDVVTLDLHMPEMNGVEVLKQVLPWKKIPFVVISALSVEEGPMVLEALAAGAVDYIQKPNSGNLSAIAPRIIECVQTVAQAKVQVTQTHSRRTKIGAQGKARSLIAIGSSTGGTEAVRKILEQLPAGLPPIVIIQHIPPVFSKAFAKRLNEACAFPVHEAEDGQILKAGEAYVAPGGKQLLLKRVGTDLRISIQEPFATSLHNPSVDVFFNSASEHFGGDVAAALLTGMGADGAAGLLVLKQLGAVTLAQNEASCVVYGMPRRAVEMGAAQQVLDLDEIAEVLLKVS